MPTYEYRCRDCGHELEVVQAFSDDPLTDCPSCGGDLRKRFGTVGISFKGSGFYKTDSRTSSKSASSGTAASSGGSDSSGDSTSTSSSGDTAGSDSKSTDAKAPAKASTSGTTATKTD